MSQHVSRIVKLPFTLVASAEDGMRNSQQMALQAGPFSGAADTAPDEDEDEEPPFPEPEEKAMYLADLMGVAAEFDAAALLEECEYNCMQ